MSEKYLVTGSHGFIGGRLVRALEEERKQVVRGDRKGTVPPGTTHIIHCGSYGNLYHQTDVYEIYRANLLNTVRLLEGFAGLFIYLSSSAVALPRQTDYTRAKRAAEEHVLSRGGIVVRPSSVTGVGEQKEHLIPQLIESCLTGKKIPLVAEPLHDFIDVSDVVGALLILCKQIPTGRPRTPINISRGVSISNREVVPIVEYYTGRNAATERVSSLRPYDSTEWKVDNAEMRALGWEPKVTLGESVRQMVAQFYPGT